MSISMIGLDTAKSVFQVHAVDETGRMVIRRKLQRSEVIAFFNKLAGCTVVMEAAGGTSGNRPLAPWCVAGAGDAIIASGAASDQWPAP